MRVISETEFPLTGGYSRPAPRNKRAISAGDCTIRRHRSCTLGIQQFAGFRDIVHEQIRVLQPCALAGQTPCSFLPSKGKNRIIGGAVVRTITAPANIARLSILRWGPLWRPAHREPDPANLPRILQCPDR